LIILASDHGEGLGEHGEAQHGLFIYNSTVHVPLILKPPARLPASARSVTNLVNTVDIAPTLVQICDFPSSDAAGFQGRSLVPLLSGHSTGNPEAGYTESLYPRTSFGWHSLSAIETDKYHYIEAPHRELYDLEHDPGEAHNIFKEQTALAATLRDELRAWESRFTADAKSSQPKPVDLEKLRELRSLGYIGGASAKAADSDAPDAADPKDRIGIYTRIIRSTELADDGRYSDSDTLLKAAAQEDPKAYLPPFLLGENALAQRDFGTALARYRQTLDLNPRYEMAAIGLAQAALGAGDAPGALKAFQWAAELNPNNYLVKLAMAGAYEELKRPGDALALQKEVLSAHPDDGKANSDHGVTLVRLKQYQEALAPLQKAVQVGYRTAVTLNFLGTALLATGKQEEAVRAYQEATRLDPQYAAPVGNLALFSLREGRGGEARHYYQRVCELDSKLCQELRPRFP
jgi:Flp pilus assembly protein TadD